MTGTTGVSVEAAARTTGVSVEVATRTTGVVSDEAAAGTTGVVSVEAAAGTTGVLSVEAATATTGLGVVFLFRWLAWSRSLRAIGECWNHNSKRSSCTPVTKR